MRFLLDENVPFELVAALADRGHDVAHMARVEAQADDVDVLARAVRDEAVLITFDSDFGRLIFYERRTPPPGVIYMQSRPWGAAQTIGALLEALDDDRIELTGRFVVIDQEAGIRALPFV